MSLNLILMASGFIVTLAVGVGFMIAVMSGNLKAMQFLAKNGVALFCGDIDTDYKLLRYVNKEGICWLKIPNICYLPVMVYSKGKYKNHNFLQKENNYGEVYLSESSNSVKLSKIALKNNNNNGDKNYFINDLSILDGSRQGNSTNMREANFSNLRGLSHYTQEIHLMDNGILRKFKVMGVVEQCLGEMTSLKFSTRSEFIGSLLNNSIYRINYDYTDSNVIVLRSKSDILNLLVLLIEVS